MKAQMIRVISSPSSSTTGFLTVIFGIRWLMPRRCASGGAGRQADRGTQGEALAGGKGEPEDAEMRRRGASSRRAWSWDQPSQGRRCYANPDGGERRYLGRMNGLGGERKIATKLFADLVGSTELAATLDPEDLRGRLEPFFEAARNALEQHGGTVEKYIGDAVMAVFGTPVAHGDDPDRAVAAGLDVAERVGQLDGELTVRVGIETGEVLSVQGAGDLRVTGEAVNAAARLQQAAQPGEVLVGERAARACRRARLEANGAVEAKGIPERLGAYRAVAVESEAEVSAVPLVGREDDLDMLRLIARRAARERLPQLVTVIGESGIGKTRLGAELFRELRSDPDPWRTIVGRSPPYDEGIAFWALGEILRDAADLSTDASPDDVERSLRELLSELGAQDASSLAAGLPVAIRGRPDCDAEEELNRAWRRFASLLATDRPLAIGVDDAHWADEGTLELL